MNYKNHRQKIQLASLSISSLIFAVATYGLFTDNDSLFIIGLIFIGFVVLGGILLAPLFGRFWCGWLCPRGVFLDRVLAPMSMNRRIPKILRTNGFKNMMLAAMTLLLGLSLLGYNPVLRSDNPLSLMGGFLVLMCIVSTILLAVPLGIIFKPRTWCSFCPMGYIQSLLAKKRLLKLQVNNCVECKLCHKDCPMELDVTDTSDNDDCFNCMKCVDACKRNSITPTISLTEKPVESV
ncbi:MAG: 4Fe-4S binding protein [Methanosarcinales archaeon]|nr:4Fe-4S binding protein [Methanosarcinales archaeon]